MIVLEGRNDTQAMLGYVELGLELNTYWIVMIDQCCKLESGQQLFFVAWLVYIKIGKLGYSDLVAAFFAILVIWGNLV